MAVDKIDFISHLTKRLGRPMPTTPPEREMVGAPDFWKRFNWGEEQRINTFIAELENLGGAARRCQSIERLHEALQQLLEELNVRSFIQWGSGRLKEFALENVLEHHHRVRWDDQMDREENLSAWAGVEVGITAVDFAVAYTGSLVVCAKPDQMRSVSLLPTIHIAIVKSSQIRTRMGEVMEEITQWNEQGMPSAIHFITGPSRSADIENDLSIGVHGPAAVYAFILEEEKIDCIG